MKIFLLTFMGMVKAGTELSGTGASTVRIPSADSVDTILAVSASAGSLRTTGRWLPSLLSQVRQNHF